MITNVGRRQGQADLVSRVEHEVVSADVDLDLHFDSHEDLPSFLDFFQARRDGDSLMQLWSFCKPLTDDLLGAFYDTVKLSGQRPANEVAVQTGLFCGKLANKSTTEFEMPSPLDTYAVYHMCLKVRIYTFKPGKRFCDLCHQEAARRFVLQLIWHTDVDSNVKAWVCGTILCYMAAAAGKVQV